MEDGFLGIGGVYWWEFLRRLCKARGWDIIHAFEGGRGVMVVGQWRCEIMLMIWDGSSLL